MCVCVCVREREREREREKEREREREGERETFYKDLAFLTIVTRLASISKKSASAS